MALLQQFNRLEAFTVTCLAGTTQALPQRDDVSFNPGDVVGLEIVIPYGHAGLTGLQIAQAHQPIIPFDSATFLVGDDERIEWPLIGLSDTGSFQTVTFNSDVFNHSFLIRFLVNDFGVPGARPLFPQPLPFS